MGPKKKMGTAAMSSELRERVCRAGGLKTSSDREHMREIGRLGGISVSRDKAYMREIGKKGGSAPKKRKDHD